MRPYWAILSARFCMMLQYRAAAAAGLFTQIFFGLVLVMVYEAFYASSARPQPMGFPQVVSYVWLGQALLALLPWNVDKEVLGMVRSGAVAYELCRPVDMYNLWFARALAWRTAPTLLRSVPLTVLTMFVFPLLGLGKWRLAPPAAGNAVWFACSMGCTILLSSALTTLMNITLMWTIASEGAWTFLASMGTLCSGLVIPLPLFPDWVQPVLRALPFAGLMDLPYRIYLGNIQPAGVSSVLAHQVFWIAALVLCGRWLLARGMRRMVIQGG